MPVAVRVQREDVTVNMTSNSGNLTEPSCKVTSSTAARLEGNFLN